jgi:hypothetical protein
MTIQKINSCCLRNEKILKNKQIELTLYYRKLDRLNSLTNYFRFSVKLKNSFNEKLNFFPKIIFKDVKDYLLQYEQIKELGFCDVTTNHVHYFNIEEIDEINLYITSNKKNENN